MVRFGAESPALTVGELRERRAAEEPPLCVSGAVRERGVTHGEALALLRRSGGVGSGT